MNISSRRRFLRHSATVTAALSLAPAVNAIEPFRREGPARMRLSLAAYSFRNHFKHFRGKVNAGGRLDIPGFIDWCAAHDCPGAELTSYFFPPDLTADYIKRVRKHADAKKIAISGTAVGNNFSLPPGPRRDEQIAHVKEWVDHSAVLGAPHIRIFAGTAPKGTSEKEADHLVISALEECCDYAGRQRIILGLENHDSISTAERLIRLIKQVKSPWLGVNLDSGNFRTADPYRDFAECAPYAANVQLKVELQPTGAKEKQEADLEQLVKILRAARYQGFVALEYEAKEDPYQAVPPVLARLKPLLGA